MGMERHRFPGKKCRHVLFKKYESFIGKRIYKEICSISGEKRYDPMGTEIYDIDGQKRFIRMCKKTV